MRHAHAGRHLVLGIDAVDERHEGVDRETGTEVKSHARDGYQSDFRTIRIVQYVMKPLVVLGAQTHAVLEIVHHGLRRVPVEAVHFR